MKKIPIRLWFLVLIPMAVVLWISAKFLFINIEVGKESMTWEEFKYQLRNATIEYKGKNLPLPIVLDQSFTTWGEVQDDEIFLHYIRDPKATDITILRSSNIDFRIIAAFNTRFIEDRGEAERCNQYLLSFPLLSNKLSNYLRNRVKKEKFSEKTKARMLEMSKKKIISGHDMKYLLDKDILSRGELDYLWFINDYDIDIPLLEIIELVIPTMIGFEKVEIYFRSLEHYNFIHKKVWRVDHYLLKYFAVIALIGGFVLTILFGWKDLIVLGYRPGHKFKMLHWWHYLGIFLPRTEPKIRKHFLEKYKEYIEEKKKKQLERFWHKCGRPDWIKFKRLRYFFYYGEEKGAKDYCLMRSGIYSSNLFPMKLFFDFMKLSNEKRERVAKNLVYLKNTKKLTLQELLIEKSVTPQYHEIPSTPEGIFLDQLDEQYRSQFDDNIELLKAFSFHVSFAKCFQQDPKITELNFLRNRMKFLLNDLKLDKKDSNKFLEFINIKSSEDDLSFILSILLEIKERKLSWKERDIYLELLLNNKTEEILQKLFPKKKQLVVQESITDQKKHKEISSDILQGKTILIVANFMKQSQVQSLISAFEKESAKAYFVHQIPRKKPREVDIVLFFTGQMNHGIGKFFKSRNYFYLRMSNVNSKIVLSKIKTILEKD